MSIAYYASKISDNMSRTQEGYLVCRDAVIARTGFQRYRVGDLPQESAEALGVDIGNPEAHIDLYRSALEVFSAATIASFEGKPVCDEHPRSGFVDPHNFTEYVRGHAQNVRRGKDPLDSGEWPLIADILLTAEPLISKVESGEARELSCGYEYKLARDGERILQIGILGNHVAVVPKGRAGPEARIYDSAEPELKQDAVEALILGTTPKKEKPKVAKTNMLRHLFGLGLKALAADAETKPEDLAEAAEALNAAKDEEPDDAKKKAADEKEAEAKKASDAKAKDAEEKAAAEKKEKEDAEAKAEAEKLAGMRKVGDARCKDCAGQDAKCRDCRAHDALDTVLQAHPAEEGEDADMEELKELMTEFMAGESDPDAANVIEPVNDSEDLEAGEKASKKAADAAAASSFEFLKTLRPVVARSNDSAVKKAFNAALQQHTRTSRATTGGYSEFAGASATARARDNNPGDDEQCKRLDAFYEKQRGKNSTEVK